MPMQAPDARVDHAIMHRRIALIALLASAALLFGAATPAAAMKKSKVDLQTRQTAAVTAGDTVWVSLLWLAEGDAENVRVVAERLPRGVTVEYPSNTGDHSGPSTGSTLGDGELDYTALRLSVPYGTKTFNFGAAVSWESDGKTHDRSTTVSVPVVDHEGGDVEQTTTRAVISAGEATWVDIWFAGLAPRIDGFSLSVTDHPGLDITYPGEGAATSLHNDALLEDGESDVARVLVDAGDLEPGTYVLDTNVGYEVDGQPATLAGTVEVEVTG